MQNLYSINQRLNALAAQIRDLQTAENLEETLIGGNNAGGTDIDMNGQDLLNVNVVNYTTLNPAIPLPMPIAHASLSPSGFWPGLNTNTFYNILDNTTLNPVPLTPSVSLSYVTGGQLAHVLIGDTGVYYVEGTIALRFTTTPPAGQTIGLRIGMDNVAPISVPPANTLIDHRMIILNDNTQLIQSISGCFSLQSGNVLTWLINPNSNNTALGSSCTVDRGTSFNIFRIG